MKGKFLEGDSTVFGKQRATWEDNHCNCNVDMLESSEVLCLKTGVELVMATATCLCYTELHQGSLALSSFIPAQALKEKVTKMHRLS